MQIKLRKFRDRIIIRECYDNVPSETLVKVDTVPHHLQINTLFVNRNIKSLIPRWAKYQS